MRSVYTVLVLALALIASASASRGGRAEAPSASCVGARVHYEPGTDRDLRGLLWVSAGRRGREIVGYLFYYTAELRSGPHLRIYAGGELPNGGSTKILWVVRRPFSSTLVVTGRRLDGPGAFEQAGGSARGPSGVVFPSIVDVPSPGCWLLVLRNGRRSVRLAVEAISVDAGYRLS